VDYIQEEWKRQQDALALLLLGGEREQAENEVLTEDGRTREQGHKGADYQNTVIETSAEELPEIWRGQVRRSRTLPAMQAVLTGEQPLMSQRTEAEPLWLSGGTSEENARALSLAFERDARRYDGGFSLY